MWFASLPSIHLHDLLFVRILIHDVPHTVFLVHFVVSKSLPGVATTFRSIARVNSLSVFADIIYNARARSALMGSCPHAVVVVDGILDWVDDSMHVLFER